MTQRAYKNNIDALVSGGLSATGGETRFTSYIAATDITPGQIVSFDADGKVTPVGGASLGYAGIVLNDHLAGSGDGDVYAEGDLVPVYSRCQAGVTLTGATASVRGGAVYRVIATGAITAVASGTATAIIPNARFENAATTGDVADVYFG